MPALLYIADWHRKDQLRRKPLLSITPEKDMQST
jgi:hypothetical protein